VLVALVVLALALLAASIASFLRLDPPEKKEEAEPEPGEEAFGDWILRGRKPLVVLQRFAKDPCPGCNGRTLAWSKDPRRAAWQGVCRRCGLVRMDVCGGDLIEMA